MAVTIDHYGIRATIEGGQWKCQDRQVLGLLQQIATAIDPGGDVPNPDLLVAQETIKRLGGRIVKSDKIEYNLDVVY